MCTSLALAVSVPAAPANSQATGGTGTLAARTLEQVAEGLQTLGVLPDQPIAPTCSQVAPSTSNEEQKRLERFGRLKPPEFSGAESKDAHDFIDRCQRILRTNGILETNGVSFITFHLTWAAYRWWEAYELSRPTGAAQLMWHDF